MDPPEVRGHPQESDHGCYREDAIGMGLFRRKRTGDEEAQRCPRCRERLPDGADECLMCGLALGPLGSPSRDQEAKTSTGVRPNG
jgi:hypothetical protein